MISITGKHLLKSCFWLALLTSAINLADDTAKAQIRDEPPRTFDCLLEPHLRLKLATPVAGVLKQVAVDRGDAIRKDQIVAQLESAVEEANVELSNAHAQNDSAVKGRRARLEFLERKRDRIRTLQGRGAASNAALDEIESDVRVAAQDVREAESSLRIAKLEHKRATELLRQRSIASPIDGVVVERSLGSGEYAYEQAPIMTVAQIDPLNVEVYLPFSLYGAIAIGTTAVVHPEDPIGGAYTVLVDVVDPVFDARSGTFGIRLKLPNPDKRIPAGLRCKLQFETPLKVPGTAPAN